MPFTFYVPQNITVHLGAPNDSSAENVTVPFVSYIKNVASSEIYPTWPESAIRANIYAQITFALNRIFTQHYRSRGYPFDITNSTQYDQSFVYGRDFFENIGKIVDDIFNNYIVRQNNIEPIFARYCNGTTSVCPGGLSQWGTVELANQGYTPYEILQYYYGNDINIVTNAPVADVSDSYPGTPLRIGSYGKDVLLLQLALNRISRNYPAIPKIAYPNSVFGVETEDAVKKFQEIFNLTQDGIVGKATWYKIYWMYTTVKRLSELDSEGVSLETVSRQFRDELSQGDRGDEVRLVQYFLSVIAEFNDFIPSVNIDGIYGPDTAEAVRVFQRSEGLEQTGVVNEETWNELYSRYTSVVAGLPEDYFREDTAIYPGTVLRRGMSGNSVRQLQTYLSKISEYNSLIPAVTPTGYFGMETERAVLAFQRANNLPPKGVVGLSTWEEVSRQYNNIILSEERSEGQYPGYVLSENSIEGGA